MSLFNASYALSGLSDLDVVEDERMSRHTTYRIGGPCALFLTCHSYHALRRAIEVLLRENIPWVVVGKGSNLLVADAGYRGAVLTLGREFSCFTLDDDGCHVTAGAGLLLARLVNEALKLELTGLEFAVGIPGTVGGAVSMNAGSRQEWLGSHICHVVTYKPGVGLQHYGHDDIVWMYRASTLPHDEIILEIVVELHHTPKLDIQERMERCLARRRRTQPLSDASCGSVFKNPAGEHVGSLIERCGLKGFCVGAAEVSNVHANFIVNKGGATAADVADVIKHVHETVKETHGIELQPEVKFLGF